VFGLVAIWFWWLARLRAADPVLQRWSTVLCGLLALQGVVGLDQYENHLPTGLVWIHVGLACITWLTVLWTMYAAGRLREHAATVQEPQMPPPAQGSRDVDLPGR
jgi:cytochrome c oxidase assembly protein subunit 15